MMLAAAVAVTQRVSIMEACRNQNKTRSLLPAVAVVALAV